MVEPAASSRGLKARSRPDPVPIFGRAQELELIHQLLVGGTSQLLTLVGPAGVGKTRLALEAVTRFGDAFRDGAWFVDLTSLSDPSAVPAAVAESLGLTDAGRMPEVERLAAYLQEREMLLILDNFERVLPAAAVLEHLLATAPGLRLLVTSREALHLRREQTLPVPPLALPDPNHLLPLEKLAQVPSVALFLQRARMMDPGFHLTNEHAGAVAELVVHLDGLPLAIELAAARISLLSPRMLLERLGERLSLLRWEAQDIPERQQTLKGAIAWSYDLLTSDEQMVFRSLAVFAGGFTLEGVEAVVASPDISRATASSSMVLDGIGSLVDKSLVGREDDGMGGYRFRLFESVREFALAQAKDHSEEERLRRGHADYYLRLAERAVPELVRPQQGQWFARLEHEHENLRSALGWLIDHGEGELALRMATALSWFWEARGYVAEGRRQLKAALDGAPNADARLRARALSGLGSLLVWVGWIDSGVDQSRAVLTEALQLARSVHDTEAMARSMRSLGVLARHTGDLEAARRYLNEALTYWRDAGNTWGTANALLHLGAMELYDGHHQEATRVLEESLAASREIGDVFSGGLALVWLVFAAGEQGDVAGGVARLHELLDVSNEVQNRRLLYLCGVGVAWVLRDRADPKQLARLLGSVDQLSQMMGLELGRGFYASIAISKATETLRGKLGTFEAALAEGRSFTFAETASIIAEILDGVQTASAARGEAKAGGLSPREQEVLRLVAEGLSNKDIGKRLFVSEGTVKTHVTSVFNKLGVETRAQAVAVAANHGLLPSDHPPNGRGVPITRI
ncbi:MAG TPA: LuxR C-terminal-related transcriptional regulator [Candidatus Sulfotelmatobacter sp.]|nr:LuxR C-terminal-related transcriptional regulator [Candidatus Sulfotelmatobacter sp.]